MIQFSPGTLLSRKSFVVLLYFIAAAYVFGIWVWSADTPTTSFNGDPRSKLSEIVYGTAHKPYVQRVLIPIFTRSIHSVVPTSTWDTFEQKLLDIPKVQKETVRLGWETDFLSEYLIALSLTFLCLFGFSFAVRNLWSAFYKTEQVVTNIVPIIALLVLPPMFPTGPHYIYDFPTLLFFTLGLALLIRRKWTLFYPVFVVGCLNKETMVLLSFVFILLEWKKLLSQAAILHLTAQVLLFAVIKTIISLTFAANPGNVLDFHLYLNLHLLLMGYNWTTLVIAAFTVWFVLHDWRSKHPTLRQSALLIIPFGLLLLWGGVIAELRDLYELYPIFLIFVLHTVFFSLLKVPYHLNRFSATLID